MNYVPLGEVAKLDRNGVDPSEIQPGTKYIGLEHISGETGLIEPATVLNGELKSTKFRFTKNHVLTGKLRPNLRKSAIAPFDGICSTDIIPLLPTKKLDARYLLHFLRTDEFVRKATMSATGVNLPRLSPGRLSEFRIPLPPLAKQKRIAAILDQADALRRLRRQSIGRLNTLNQSIFYEIFGDPITNPMDWPEAYKLGEISEIISGITKGRKLNGQATREVPYLAVVNVQDKYLELEPLKTINATEEEIRRYALYRDDLLLTEGGDPDKLGRGTLWHNEVDECIHQNHVFRVRLHNDVIEPVYLNWIIGSSRGKNYFLKSAKQTTGIATINKTQLKAFPLLTPPIELQRKFRDHINRIAGLTCRFKAEVRKVEALFSSLQQRAFRGEL